VPIRFQLNGVSRSVDNIPPTMTVLDYLRGVERLTGTKEGCAEGDCGACTIAVARPGPDGPRFEAVNSCLMLVPQLEGRDVLTVEGLAGRDGQLHPVQSALVEADATQCGFCTPGFAMAMFAFSQDGSAKDDEAIHEALAGNLCRCTGYRPIVEACRKLTPAPAGCLQDKPASGGTAALGDAVYRNGDQIFHLPASLDALATLRAQYPDAIMLGGGTDLGLRVSKEREAFPEVIWTGGVAELKRIADKDGAIEFGAAVTYSEALPLLERHFPSFAEMVRRIGSRQIRNLGTFAGNLATASPIGDTIPCLMALNADVTLRSQTGARTLLVEQFITGYRKTAMQSGEFIESVRIPVLGEGRIFKVYKLSKRFDQDISTVVAAFSVAIENDAVRELRAAFGGMAAQAARAKHVESALTGKPWSEASLADIDAVIAQDFKPMSDHRGGADYRLRAAANLVRRFHAETTSAQPAQVWWL
jgi:xanthine dehydrogenase small subunit